MTRRKGPHRKSRGAFRRLLRKRESRPFKIGAVVIFIYTLVAILSQTILPLDPYTTHRRDIFAPPSLTHPLGSDEIGRDILARVLSGAAMSLGTVAVSLAVALPVGTTLGLLAGFFGGTFDLLVMRVVDVWLCFPSIIIAILLVLLIGVGPLTPMVAIGIVSIPRFVRVARSRTLSVRETPYVEAVHALGASTVYIVFRTILPNMFNVVLVQAAVTAGFAVLMESGLSFLGLGTSPPLASWGSMLKMAQMYLYQAPWYGIFPGVLLTVLILAMNMVADGLNDMYRTS